MKNGLLFLAILILHTLQLSAQTVDQMDSLANRACETIKRSEGQPDSIRLQRVFSKHITPFVKSLPKEVQDSAMLKIYFRLQRNCPAFKKSLDMVTPSNPYWKTVSEKPVTRLEKNTCRTLMDHKNYFYFEPSGDTVHLDIDNGQWVDHFKDGSHSRLSFAWINDCEFEITFIESDNIIRKNFSNPGDKYRYTILNKKSNYFELSVEIVGTNSFSVFKIYY